MKFLLNRFRNSTNRYFWFGVKYALRFRSAFAREIALDDGMEFIHHNQIEGDYLEFGVFKGRTFSAACSMADDRNLDMHCWAFDSFEGLPAAEGEFRKGGWKAPKDVFLNQVNRHIRDPKKLHVVQGWFSETLKETNPELKPLRKAAVVWVDCDIYESAVPVLSFLTTRLQDGTLIYFDDWFCLNGNPNRGEQRACREWLAANPRIRLSEFMRFGWFGKAFIVHLEST